MTNAQKPDLVFQRNGRVHLNRRGRQFSRLLAAEVCASAVVMVVMLDTPCSEVECKTTGYPLHSHVPPSLPLPCVTVCHQVSTELYNKTWHVFPFSVCSTANAWWAFYTHNVDARTLPWRTDWTVPFRQQWASANPEVTRKGADFAYSTLKWA